MRKQFVKTVESLMSEDKSVITLLGDIGVFGFRNAFMTFPNRIYNVGILEQSMVSLAAGLTIGGHIPIVHTIAPFIVERALEQLKIDFCYQKLRGNFVSVGASYDYAALGCTHHCPADIPILKNLPNMEIVIPGTAQEFDLLFRESYSNSSPTYFRLHEKSNKNSYPVSFGKAHIIKQGSDATIIAVGPMLNNVLEACFDLNVTILYYTTLAPFDSNTLKENISSNKIILCEPCYSGAILNDIQKALPKTFLKIGQIGIPISFLHNYGTFDEHENALGFSPSQIKAKIIEMIYE